MNLFHEIKRSVSMPDICERYGIQRTRNGFISCPFHAEKTPSCKVYDGERGFYCFGCGKSGDVIDFVAAHFSLDMNESAKMLNRDFSLGLPLERKMTLREKYEIQARAKVREQENQRRKQERAEKFSRYFDAYSEWSRLDRQKTVYKPKTPEETPDPLFVEALQEIEDALFELEEAESEVIKIA